MTQTENTNRNYATMLRSLDPQSRLGFADVDISLHELADYIDGLHNQLAEKEKELEAIRKQTVEECAKEVDKLVLASAEKAKLCAHTEDLYQRYFNEVARLREASALIRALSTTTAEGDSNNG